MANAMIALATITLGASQSTVTFSSISGSYRDLRLIISNITGSIATRTVFNGDTTAANYNSVTAYGDGATASSTSVSGTRAYLNLHFNAASENWLIDIMDYSATDKHKTVLAKLTDSTSASQMASGRWGSTAAITSIALTSPIGYPIGSVFTLYGAKA